MNIRTIAVLAVAALAASDAPAQTPLGTAFTYQGRLENAGNPASGLHDLRFRLYDALAGGTQVGATVCFNNVSVTDGLFTVPLDFGAQFDGQQRFLEIDVRADSGRDCTNSAGFVILSPRQPLTTAPHAAFAMNADRLDGLDSTAFLQSIPVPLTLSGSNPIAGVLNVTNSTGPGIQAFSTTNSAGLSGYSSGSTGYAVFGRATDTTGANRGGWFQSFSDSGIGAEGRATAASGTTYGLYGLSDSTSGRGVFGSATATSGTTYGVYGQSVSTNTSAVGVYGTGHFGGVFESDSTTGVGVKGYATAATGSTYGVFGVNVSTDGRGVVGWTTAATGFTYGGLFQSDSENGRAVFGHATAATGSTRGGEFWTDSSGGRGVFGRSTAALGSSYGVYGEATTVGIGYAVYASGDMGASGVKPFRIDHPDDPANKYLLHYAAESPEVINFYRGTVMLDGAGEAVVELPHYFAKINKTPSYMLTAVGAPMPMLHVATEIDENALSAGSRAEPGESAPACSFRIAGGAPGGKVSWRIEAVRNDRWVQQRGAPVEVEKQDLERGTYQHPDLYGQPPERGMDYDAKRERTLPPDTTLR